MNSLQFNNLFIKASSAVVTKTESDYLTTTTLYLQSLSLSISTFASYGAATSPFLPVVTKSEDEKKLDQIYSLFLFNPGIAKLNEAKEIAKTMLDKDLGYQQILKNIVAESIQSFTSAPNLHVLRNFVDHAVGILKLVKGPTLQFNLFDKVIGLLISQNLFEEAFLVVKKLNIEDGDAHVCKWIANYAIHKGQTDFINVLDNEKKSEILLHIVNHQFAQKLFLESIETAKLIPSEPKRNAILKQIDQAIVSFDKPKISNTPLPTLDLNVKIVPFGLGFENTTLFSSLSRVTPPSPDKFLEGIDEETRKMFKLDEKNKEGQLTVLRGNLLLAQTVLKDLLAKYKTLSTGLETISTDPKDPNSKLFFLDSVVLLHSMVESFEKCYEKVKNMSDLTKVNQIINKDLHALIPSDQRFAAIFESGLLPATHSSVLVDRLKATTLLTRDFDISLAKKDIKGALAVIEKGFQAEEELFLKSCHLKIQENPVLLKAFDEKIKSLTAKKCHILIAMGNISTALELADKLNLEDKKAVYEKVFQFYKSDLKTALSIVNVKLDKSLWCWAFAEIVTRADSDALSDDMVKVIFAAASKFPEDDWKHEITKALIKHYEKKGELEKACTFIKFLPLGQGETFLFPLARALMVKNHYEQAREIAKRMTDPYYRSTLFTDFAKKLVESAVTNAKVDIQILTRAFSITKEISAEDGQRIVTEMCVERFCLVKKPELALQLIAKLHPFQRERSLEILINHYMSSNNVEAAIKIANSSTDNDMKKRLHEVIRDLSDKKIEGSIIALCNVESRPTKAYEEALKMSNEGRENGLKHVFQYHLAKNERARCLMIANAMPTEALKKQYRDLSPK